MTSECGWQVAENWGTMLAVHDRNHHVEKGIPIRLTDERWIHISEEHSELAGMRLEVLETIADPVRIYQFVEKRSHAVILSEAKNLLLLFSSTYEILRRLRLLGMTD